VLSVSPIVKRCCAAVVVVVPEKPPCSARRRAAPAVAVGAARGQSATSPRQLQLAVKRAETSTRYT
jgi:hypothetical protein